MAIFSLSLSQIASFCAQMTFSPFSLLLMNEELRLSQYLVTLLDGDAEREDYAY